MSAVFVVAHRLRPMSEADLPRIHRIELASYEYPWSLGNFADSLKAGYSMWVREAEGEIIGYYVMMAAAGEAHLALLQNPPLVSQVEAVALAGERMPQKSTYFYPKLLSGLVISPLDPSETIG